MISNSMALISEFMAPMSLERPATVEKKREATAEVETNRSMVKYILLLIHGEYITAKFIEQVLGYALLGYQETN